MFTNALAAVEECVSIYTAHFEEDGASVEGARAGGVAILGVPNGILPK